MRNSFSKTVVKLKVLPKENIRIIACSMVIFLEVRISASFFAFCKKKKLKEAVQSSAPLQDHYSLCWLRIFTMNPVLQTSLEIRVHLQFRLVWGKVFFNVPWGLSQALLKFAVEWEENKNEWFHMLSNFVLSFLYQGSQFEVEVLLTCKGKLLLCCLN